MKVIFIKDLKGQGKRNEIKEVKAGYAQNFLIKNGYAVALTESSKKKLDTENKKAKEADELDKKENLKIKEQIEKTNIKFKLKTGKQDQVFGSISTKQIQDELKKKNYDIDKKKIKIDLALNTLGCHYVEIELYKNIKAKLQVELNEK